MTDRLGIDPEEFARLDIAFHAADAATYDDRIVRQYAIYHGWLLHPFLDCVAADRPGGRALDLGCGTGVVSVALGQRGFDTFGVDHSPEMLAVARHNVAAHGLENRVRLELGDALSLQYADETFDLVTCQGTLHHLPRMEPALVELHRVLRAGGFFYISDPAREVTPVGRAVRVLQELGYRPRKGEKGESPASVEEPVSARELESLLTGLGLEYELRFATHLPLLHHLLSDRMRLRLMKLLSAPWPRRGDLLFVTGRKPKPSRMGAADSRA